jgi:hypothetical protein
VPQARPLINPVVALDPQAITVHPAPASREVFLRYRGLPFACWDDGVLSFGPNEARQELTPASCPAFDRLLQDLQLYRASLAADTRHSLYRAQPDRWLEAIVRHDVSRIDSVLNSALAYTQVFAWRRARHYRRSHYHPRRPPRNPGAEGQRTL